MNAKSGLITWLAGLAEDDPRLVRVDLIRLGEDDPANQPPVPVEQELFTVPQAIDFLHTSRTSLYKAEKEGRLHPVWFGGRKLYRRADLINALEKGGKAKEA